MPLLDKLKSLRAFLLLWPGQRRDRRKCTLKDRSKLQSIKRKYFIYLVKIIPVFKNINPNPITQRAEYLLQNIYIAWKESYGMYAYHVLQKATEFLGSCFPSQFVFTAEKSP